MIHFKRIGDRLLFSVGSIVVAGLLILGLFYARQLEESIMAENEMSLKKVTDSVSEAVSALMVGGHAKVAQEFAGRLKNVPNIIDYRIVRVDGTEAFVDNHTIDQVNRKLGGEEFVPRENALSAAQILPPTHPALQQARETGQQTFDYLTLPGGHRSVTILGPIKSHSTCWKCHQEGEKVRGFIKLTASLAQVDMDVSRTKGISIVLILLGLVSIIVFIFFMTHRVIVRHLEGISGAMEVAAQGDLSSRVDVRQRDEIGHMANAFNRMNDELSRIYAGLAAEKTKLSTIIQGANSGIVVTDEQQHIVLVNDAARELLGKEEQSIIQNGFLMLFDNEAWMRERLAHSEADSGTGTLSWNGRTLSVQASTIRDTDNRVIGSAALIRDITEEKRLEEELKKQSITDALTGLHNRRHFDSLLETEFKRWQRYKQPLSVIMLDVDHFKKFNDTHGHECGDHVLEAIGKVLKSMSSATLVPCRYGGEEMVLVLPGMEQAKAVEIAEVIRRNISELVIDGLKVTVSIGVAGLPGHAADDADALVKLADNALYQAKKEGRNLVRSAA
jgi:diguanylate cyclase (GGDEF)-like protein/PAS domain S-box-containing protein